MPDRALSLTFPNAPRDTFTCRNSSQAAEGRCWGRPAGTRHSALGVPIRGTARGSGLLPAAEPPRGAEPPHLRQTELPAASPITEGL